ncbi:MAG: flagellar basal body rod protein FlgC [bacterium]|nr:flagellar basal body rod protein FlgC [bacterium]
MYGSLDISTSALVAQRTRMDVIAGNIANIHATRDPDGAPSPYQRRVALLSSGNPRAGAGAPGVHVQSVIKDPAPFRKVFDPSHPDAVRDGPDAGYVLFPNVELTTEMINAMEAARAYEANVTVMEITKTMAAGALRVMA